MQGKYGDEGAQFYAVSMAEIPDFERISEYEKYDICIHKIATEAPIRICENELVSGAATLGMAIGHEVPAQYKGASLWNSVSHLTLDFDKVLKVGMNGIEAKIYQRLKDTGLSDSQKEILNSMKNVITSMRLWHNRYLDALKNTKTGIYQNLLQVPFKPARSYYEAVQSLWFTFAFTRLCGNWPGIGRIDEMLGDYLKRDLECGRITLNDAREIMASFFIKGCEWIKSHTLWVSGDGQHYQNIVLSGVDSNGNDITNEVTYLVLDIVEELGISDFPITMRINQNTPQKLLVRVAEVMRHGGGVIAVYNEALIIDSLNTFGYSVEE